MDCNTYDLFFSCVYKCLLLISDVKTVMRWQCLISSFLGNKRWVWAKVFSRTNKFLSLKNMYFFFKDNLEIGNLTLQIYNWGRACKKIVHFTLWDMLLFCCNVLNYERQPTTICPLISQVSLKLSLIPNCFIFHFYKFYLFEFQKGLSLH